jgi:hypothetical protein
MQSAVLGSKLENRQLRLSFERRRTMKTIVSLALLCLMGCASKPKPGSGVVITTIQFIKGCPVDFTVEIDMETGSYDCLGSISHVTPEQWQAAQGLYHSSPACDEGEHWKMIPEKDEQKSGEYYADLGDPNMVWYCQQDSQDTFPPSGDETHKEKPLVINQSAVNSPDSNIISGGNITINGKKQPPSGDAK